MMTLRTGLIFFTILFAVASMSFSQSQGPISTPLEEHKRPPSQTEAHKTPVQNFQQLPNNPVSTIKPDTSEVQENSKNPKKEREDKTTTDWWLIGFTGTLTGIPLEAYDYIVNGKPVLDWVVERQCVKTDKDSGIVNDANDWAVETMKNPRYPLELFQRVITVSLETMKIVSSLPGLAI
jgi:Type ISP C-terminal specificity domain